VGENERFSLDMGQHFYDGCHGYSPQMGGSAMTPEEMLIRADTAMKWRRALKDAVADAYEDAARIAESKARGFPLTEKASSYNLAHNIAAAIRARTEEK
jgi:hypothetical protein